jgi:hypothetical protein
MTCNDLRTSGLQPEGDADIDFGRTPRDATRPEPGRAQEGPPPGDGPPRCRLRLGGCRAGGDHHRHRATHRLTYSNNRGVVDLISRGEMERHARHGNVRFRC